VVNEERKGRKEKKMLLYSYTETITLWRAGDVVGELESWRCWRAGEVGEL
jgi:hypothetical protein